MNKDDELPVAHKEAEALKVFEDAREAGQLLPCQLLPPSYFMIPVKIWVPVSDVNSLYAVADACAACPLREQCEMLGQDEGYGIWGGVGRDKWVFRRRIYEGDWPYD